MQDWVDRLEFFQSDVFEVLDKIGQQIGQGNTVLPDSSQIFRVYESLRIGQIRAVICGQDPYPTPGHPCGLAFSTNRDVRPIPKSLQNIYRELHDDLGIDPPEHGDLSSWVSQGVFLLNTSLTVLAGSPGSHAGFWTTLINQTLDLINRENPPTVFILWGGNARKKSIYVGKQHCVITSAHPSPLSAHTGFFGSKPFSRANEFLIQNRRDPIDWTIT